MSKQKSIKDQLDQLAIVHPTLQKISRDDFYAIRAEVCRALDILGLQSVLSKSKIDDANVFLAGQCLQTLNKIENAGRAFENDILETFIYIPK